jgi:hypothetical protein
VNNKRKILGILLITLLLVLFIVASNGLAPAAARYNSLNPYYLLSLGAPGVFYEDIDALGVNNETPGPGLPRSGKVGIYHTHTSEAFVPTAGQARSEDFSQTVVCLGEVIAAKLTASNIPVIHVKKYHDPVYKNSYTESRKSAQEMLAAHPDISLIMDIHRDGVGKTAESGRKMTTATVNNLAAGNVCHQLCPSRLAEKPTYRQ